MNCGGWFQVREQKAFAGLLTRFHLIPHNDFMPHFVGESCWCKPEQVDDKYVTEITFEHRAMDGREDFETQKRLPS